MSIYAIAHVKIKDRAEYQLYADQFLGVFEKFDGKLLAADFDAYALAGDWQADRLVVTEWPDKAALMAWLNSPAYQEIGKHRDAGADVTLIIANKLELANHV